MGDPMFEAIRDRATGPINERLVLTAVMHYSEEDVYGLGGVTTEARAAGVDIFLTAIGMLAEGFNFTDNPASKDKIRARIAELIHIEEEQEN